MVKHREDGDCYCNACVVKRAIDASGVYGSSSGASSDTRSSSGGGCEECGGTRDCIHCFNGYYYRRDGTRAICGACRGSTKCHACKGGRRQCRLPRYTEPAVCTDCADGHGNGKCIECGGGGMKIGADGINQGFCLPCNGKGKCRVCRGSGVRPPTL
jgi:hypothetical protein